MDSLTGPKRSGPKLRRLLEHGERLVLPALVLYEWRRGPRLKEELTAQEALFPSERCFPFGALEAEQASAIFQRVERPRGREIDLAIAAHALLLDASLWTLNRRDFAGIPDLELV